MLRFSALNNDTPDVGDPEVPLVVRQEEEEARIVAQYNKALAQQRSGTLTEAKQIYNEILKSDLILQCPDPADFEPEEVREHSGLLLKYNIYKNLGGIAFGAEEYEHALDLYLEAAVIDESDVSLWWKIGEAALKVTNIRLARYAFEKGLNCSPKHWPCLNNLITVLYVIGDYSACLKFIADGLSRNDMFIKGLAIRDQIFKEEPYLKKDFYSYKELFHAKSRTDTHEEEYQKYIEEALFLREKRRLLSRREEIPKVKFNKQMTYFSWSCLGECLLHLYDEVSDPEQNKSLCWPVDLEKYRRTTEQQSNLQLPPLETMMKKAAKGGHKDGEEKRGLKRKKVSPGGVETTGEPVPKRRSARVKTTKPKEEDINWTETLHTFLPEFIRSDANADTEDSQDSMTEDTESTKPSAPEDSHSQLVEEAKKVSNFINQTVRNSGCLDLMDKFLKVIVSNVECTWPSNLPSVYARIYNKIRKQIWFPSPPVFCRDAGIEYYAEFAKAILLALECQLDQWLITRSKASLSLSPGQKGVRSTSDNASATSQIEGAKEFLEDSHYLLLCIACKDIFQDFWAEFNVRFFWLQARFFMLQADNDQAINYFERGIAALTPGNGFVEDSSLIIKLHHCQMDNVINYDNVQKKLEQLERCQSLEEVNKLYETGSYRNVVDLLTPLLLRQTITTTKADDVSVSSPERPSQLLLLQESLYKLKEYKKCLLCSEITLNEAIQVLTPCEAWTSTLERLFKCLNRVLRDNSDSLNLLAKENTRRLIQNLIKVIEISMESIDANETPVATVMPWLILYRIVNYYDKGNQSTITETSQKDGENSCSQDVSCSVPSCIRFLQFSHDHLGRRSLCCDDKGIMLLQFVRNLHTDVQKPNPPAVRRELTKELEQCLFCLYGHPSKKTKNKWLQDHNSIQVNLTWEYAHIVYDFFKPPGLPELESKLHTISVEVQNVLRRLVAVVPQREVEVISFENLQAYIDGLKELQKVSDLEVTSKRTIVKDLFYYLGDFYFKNKEFSKAVKFYMHDVCLNPDRFESWAAMALARGSRLEEKIRACEPKSDGPVKKHIISTLRCFERAVNINNKNCMILEEYGSTAYMLNSHASRRLREQWQDEEFTPDTQAAFISRKTEMLELSEACFTQANQCLRTNEGEPWLHSYMLGKTAEKLRKAPEAYLDSYEKASKELHKAKASYPRRIPYHGAPEYSIEVLEMYYRIHSSVLNILERAEGEVDFEKLEEYLERASQCPFVLMGLSKEAKISTPTRSSHSSPVKRQTSVDKHSHNISTRGQPLSKGQPTSPVTSKPSPFSCVKALAFSTPVSLADDMALENSAQVSQVDPISSQDESASGDMTRSQICDTSYCRNENTEPGSKTMSSSDNDSSRASIPPPTLGGSPRNISRALNEFTVSYSDRDSQGPGRTPEKFSSGKYGKPDTEYGLTWYRDMQHSSCSDAVKESESACPSADNSVIECKDLPATTSLRMDVDDNANSAINLSEEEKVVSDAEGLEWIPTDQGTVEPNICKAEEGLESGMAEEAERTDYQKPENCGVDQEITDLAQEPESEISPINKDTKTDAYEQDAKERAEDTEKTLEKDATEEVKGGDLLDAIDSMEKGKEEKMAVDGDEHISDSKEDDAKAPSLAQSFPNDFKRIPVSLETMYPNRIGKCKQIIDRCLNAFSYCLKRFPEHYKSQYKMAYIFAYYSTHKDLQWCRDLLLGGSTARSIPLPAHGLFTDKKRTNLFQYLWRIPIDEIDRPGSFCSHICRAVELLLDVLSQLKEWDTLLLVSSFLHRTPDKDKKYLRDNDRAFLAIKAFDLSVLILKSRINEIEKSEMKRKEYTLTKQLMSDCYDAYRHAQRMQTSASMTEHLLVRGYRLLVKREGDVSVDHRESEQSLLDQAVKYCVQQYENSKKTGQSSTLAVPCGQGYAAGQETKGVKSEIDSLMSIQNTENAQKEKESSTRDVGLKQDGNTNVFQATEQANSKSISDSKIVEPETANLPMYDPSVKDKSSDVCKGTNPGTEKSKENVTSKSIKELIDVPSVSEEPMVVDTQETWFSGELNRSET